MNLHTILAACVLLTASASAQTYYVSTSGDDLNAGTPERPFKSTWQQQNSSSCNEPKA